MSQDVAVPEYGVTVPFPDDAKPDEIKAYLAKKYPLKAAYKPPGLGESLMKVASGFDPDAPIPKSGIPPFLAKAGPMVLPALGMAAGAALAPEVEGPTLGLRALQLGRAALASGLGGAMGTQANKAVRVAQGENVPASSPADVARDVASGAGAELGGRTIGSVASKALRFASRSVAPEARAASELLESKGLPGLLPHQLSTSPAIELGSTISKYGLFKTGNYIPEAEAAQNATWKDYANKVVDAVWPRDGDRVNAWNRVELGGEHVNAISVSRASYDDVFDKLYNNLTDKLDPENVPALKAAANTAGKEPMVGGVPFSQLDPSLQKALGGAGKVPFEGGVPVDIKEIKPAITALNSELRSAGLVPPKAFGEIEKSGDETWFSRAQDWRSGLRRMLREAGPNKTTDLTRAVNDIEKKLTGAMTAAADKGEPGLGDALRATDKAYAIGKRQYFNEVVNDWVNQASVQKEPGKVADDIFREGETGRAQKAYDATHPEAFAALAAPFKGTVNEKLALDTINEYKENLNPDVYQKLKGMWLHKLVDNSIDAKTGALSGTAMRQQIDRLGMDVMNTAFGGSTVKDLDDFAGAISQAEKRAGSVGKFMTMTRGLITLTQGGVLMVSSAKSTPYLAAGFAGFDIAPSVLGKMLTQPYTRRMLMEGITLSADSKEALKLGPRLIAAAYMAQHDDEPASLRPAANPEAASGQEPPTPGTR